MEQWIYDYVMVPQNMILLAVIFVITTVARLVGKDWWNYGIGERLLPLIPITMGMIFGVVFAVTGMMEIGNWLSGLILGLLCGFVVMGMFKIGKTTVAGLNISTKPSDTQTKPTVEIPAVVSGDKK